MSAALVKLLVFVIFAVVAMLNKRLKEARGNKAAPRRTVESTRRAAEVAADGEHERRIQDEIRRKIEERRRAGSAPVDRTQGQPPQLPAQAQADLATRLARVHARAAQERAREVDETRVRLEADVARAQRARDTRNAAESLRHSEELGTVSNPWIQLLRDPNEAQKAFVLREILGPPVCLR